MAESTPRITASYLESFTNRTVRLVGKVQQLRGDTATVDAGGSVNVILNRDCHLQVGRMVEIVGKVNNDLKMRILATTDFGGDINYAAYEAVVEATHRYREIFYD